MAARKNDGGPAFPSAGNPPTGSAVGGGGGAWPPVPTVSYGMSLRDAFALGALALMASGWIPDEILEPADQWGDRARPPVATAAYRIADAMLAERDQP